MAPNLHQTRLNALSNSLSVGNVRINKDTLTSSSPPPQPEPVDSDSYWEWRTDPNPDLFSSTRMVERMVQSSSQRQQQNDASSLNAENDAYWAEARFPAERLTPVVKARTTVSTGPAQYWDEALYVPTEVDTYWQW